MKERNQPWAEPYELTYSKSWTICRHRRGSVWSSVLGSFAFVSSSQSAFLLPPPLRSRNILLSRCWLPPLSFCLYLCIYFLKNDFSFVNYMVYVFHFSSQFWSLHPMFFPPPLNFHKQPQFGHLISTLLNYYLFCNNLGLFMRPLHPMPPLETGASFCVYCDSPSQMGRGNAGSKASCLFSAKPCMIIWFWARGRERDAENWVCW